MWTSSIKMFLFVAIAMVAATGLLMRFNTKINQKSRNLYLYDWGTIKPNEVVMNTSTQEEHPMILIEPHNPKNIIWKQNITAEYLQSLIKWLLIFTPEGNIFSPQSETKVDVYKNIYFVLKQKVFTPGSTMKQYLDNWVGKILENNVNQWFTVYYFPIKYVIPNWNSTEQDIKQASKLYNEIVSSIDQTCRMSKEWQLYCN